jgi:hypothetical protein
LPPTTETHVPARKQLYSDEDPSDGHDLHWLSLESQQVPARPLPQAFGALDGGGQQQDPLNSASTTSERTNQSGVTDRSSVTFNLPPENTGPFQGVASVQAVGGPFMQSHPLLFHLPSRFVVALE